MESVQDVSADADTGGIGFAMGTQQFNRNTLPLALPPPLSYPCNDSPPLNFQTSRWASNMKIGLNATRSQACSGSSAGCPRNAQSRAARKVFPGLKGIGMSFVQHFRNTLVCILALLFLIIVPGTIGATEDWKQAIGPWQWSFPRDHGAHPEYRTEWWYFTGNLKDKDGKHYGYQLTFFRQGLTLTASQPDNLWSIRDVYLAHFAIVDGSSGKFWYHDRATRTGPGLAGANTGSMDVWTLNWSAKMIGNTIYLKAHLGEMALDLELSPRKPKIFHGEKGLSTKGPNPGQASYYYSFTDLVSKGTIRTSLSQKPIDVTGTSWFDQEFGSNVLSADQVGWDWFGIHLSDGRDLMLFQLRKKDGTIESSSSGTIVEKDGTSRYLRQSDITLKVLAQWKSPKSGGTYPAKWQISIPSAQVDITLAPIAANQELVTEASTGVTYWEGAITGTGTSRGNAINIEGYAELTGYAGSLGGVF
jgi:predicted secreted hydrolase